MAFIEAPDIAKWHAQKRNLHAQVRSDDLENVVQEAWKAIDASVLVSLVKSMPSRLEAVSKAEGGYTKY